MTPGIRPVLGVLGGSGIYDFEGLEGACRIAVASPFGAPSDAIVTGRLDGLDVAFLPRHGRGHRLTPSEINYRANIDALKRVGVTDLISLSACGSFREELTPGTFVIVDQFIDRTFARAKTFFGDGLVAHVSMAEPVCRRLGGALATAAREGGIAAVRGGTYLAMEGPQFSTLAESNLYRSWTCDVVGMTNMPEAKLAREAEICYATVAMVTDYDCWHPNHAHVRVADIIAVLRANATKGQALVRQVARQLGARPALCPQGCDHVLDSAIVTPREAWEPAAMIRLSAVLGRVMARTPS
jgi:5'-methylthioadenosine phosphorylase